jgi:hypothetical protein
MHILGAGIVVLYHCRLEVAHHIIGKCIHCGENAQCCIVQFDPDVCED